GLGELWDYYAKYPYLPRLRDRKVLDAAVREILGSFDVAWADTGFAVAVEYDTTTGDFHGLAVPGDTTAFGELRDSTLLVAPGLAQAQRERERKREQATAETDDTSESSGGAIEHTPAAAPAAGARKQRQPEPSVTRNARYEARVEVDPSGDME